MSDIYTAIMKAADHIERNPRLFDFDRIDIPKCGSPGCAIGWIGHFFGATHETLEGFAMKTLLPGGSGKFYVYMNELARTTNWIKSPKQCASTLRLYAAKYHAPKPVGLPDSVRSIFTDFAKEFQSCD
jgi:alpha-beta hydrolase superfamily lysophospholipase